MKPIHSAHNDNLSKRSPRGFGPKARHELLQKLRDKGYLSEEEYACYMNDIESVKLRQATVHHNPLPGTESPG